MPRANLNKEKIFSAAADLANRYGFAALSLKALAAHFSVKPPSLFKHVRDLAEIKDALAISGFTKLRDALRNTPKMTARSYLVQICHQYRDLALQFPGEYDAFQQTHVAGSTEVYKLGEEVLQIMLAAVPGKDSTAKIHALRFIRSALHGFVHLENNKGFGLNENTNESFRLMVESIVDVVLPLP